MAAVARRHAETGHVAACRRRRDSEQKTGMTIAAEQRKAGRGLTRRAVLGGGLSLTLAGCNAAGVEMPSDAGGPGPPVPAANGPPVGETLGTGPVRVGMILPLTQNGGGPSPIGVSMRNAAQLAIDGFGAPYITLMIEDDHSSADAAAQAAQSELGAGAQLISGPVFANDVRSASAAAKSAGKPMIAFSTDVTVAAPGVYLLSFLIQGYVDRIIQYAVSSGKKSFAIMAPQNDYGSVAAQRFQDMARKPQRANGGDRPLLGAGRWRPRRSRWPRFKARSTLCSFPSRPTPCPRSRTRSRQPTSRPSSWALECGTTRGCSNCRRCRAPGSPRRQFRLRRVRSALQGEIQQRPGAARDARL